MKLDYMLDLQKTLQRIPEWKLAFAKRYDTKISVGMETRKGWNGHLEFFVFWCRTCNAFSKDYGHSFPERRYLTCPGCDKNFPHPVISAVLRECLETLSSLIRLRLTARR